MAKKAPFVWDGAMLAQKETLSRQYKAYVDEFVMPTAFWKWVFDAVQRYVPQEEFINMRTFFASQIEEQVQVLVSQQEAEGHGMISPVKWAEDFIGKNWSHSHQLHKDWKGLWALNYVVRCKKQIAMGICSEEAQAKARGELSRTHIPAVCFPPPQRMIFPFRNLPIYRPELDGISQGEKASYASHPAVQAAEWQIVAYQGIVVATATLNRTIPLVHKA
jgi:hypothetical protein